MVLLSSMLTILPRFFAWPVQQIAFADKVLLNKVDLVDDEEKDELYDRIHNINKTVEIVECTHSKWVGWKSVDHRARTL